MKAHRWTGENLAAALAVCVIAVAACGDGTDESSRTAADRPTLASASAIDRDPYAIACAHVRDQHNWAAVTRRATVAIADREEFPDLNRLRASQSLFFAMTELCRARPASYRPAREAVRGVTTRKYVVGAP